MADINTQDIKNTDGKVLGSIAVTSEGGAVKSTVIKVAGKETQINVNTDTGIVQMVGADGKGVSMQLPDALKGNKLTIETDGKLVLSGGQKFTSVDYKTLDPIRDFNVEIRDSGTNQVLATFEGNSFNDMKLHAQTNVGIDVDTDTGKVVVGNTRLPVNLNKGHGLKVETPFPEDVGIRGSNAGKVKVKEVAPDPLAKAKEQAAGIADNPLRFASSEATPGQNPSAGNLPLAGGMKPPQLG